MSGDRRNPTIADPTTQAARWKEAYDQAELADVACPGCGTRAPEDLATEFGITVARCGSCGLVYTRTPLLASQAHYVVSRDEYLAKYADVFEGRTAHPRDPNYDELLGFLESRCRFGAMLDVGSHCGFFLRRARKRGWSTTGVEPSPVSASLAREVFGLNVKTGFLADVAFPDCSFDCVTVVDVLEHIPDPRALLVEVRRVLRPGGCLLVKVPNVRYVLMKYRLVHGRFGVHRDAFDAREHVVHYSRQTLAGLLSSAGFADLSFAVPLPIQVGGAGRKLLRSTLSQAARLIPRGTDSPFATDIAAIGQR